MKMCACGKPLHYTDKTLQDQIEMMVAMLGECIEVEVSGKRYKVPRHYIALHGLKGAEVAALGFEEVPLS